MTNLVPKAREKGTRLKYDKTGLISFRIIFDNLKERTKNKVKKIAKDFDLTLGPRSIRQKTNKWKSHFPTD